MNAKKHDVCSSEELVTGELKPVKIGRTTIVLTRLPSGDVKAINGRCPHHGAKLEFGCLTGYAHSEERENIDMSREGEILRCPWHGFEFDLQTGDPVVTPLEANAMRLRFFEVAEENGRVMVTK